ncbi:MAG: FAD-binding oxidoreductase [Desulfurococcales archaeon]|nr:FAD-binding oxidoreductase [Desulfurococcales archaeon]
MSSYDVLIVGGGIVGLSTAYHILKKDGSKKVLVIDKSHGIGGGDSGKSAAAFRAFFYSRTNLALAHSSIEFYKHVQENEKFDLGMLFVGYLLIFDKEKYNRVSKVITDLKHRGLDCSEFEPEDLAKKLGIRTSLAGDEEAELMGLKDPYRGIYIPLAGILKPENLLEYYSREVQKLGGRIEFDTSVEKFIIEPKKLTGIPGEPFPWQEAEIKGVITNKGEIRSEKVIVAAGAWTHKLLDPIGIDCHSKPKKRQIFTIPASKPELNKLLYADGINKYNIMPFILLPGDVYLRPEPFEKAFWVGLSDDLGRPFILEENPQPEEKYYMYGIYPVLHQYFPQFTDMWPSSMWAGHYDISLDGQPVIFEDYNLIVSAGTSGSGIMKADAIGRITASLYYGEREAELYTGEAFRVSDLSLQYRKVEPELLII